MLKLDQVSQAYGSREVVKNLSFDLIPGQIGCLLGPSGCGKTTVLRCIAGFEPVAAGHIEIGGETVSSPARRTPPERRQIGMVFQDYALFPHLTVAGNIAFGLGALGKEARQTRVDELLALTGLLENANKYPHQLSGGQQQRVALARALAPRPRLLLMDEPFSNLDVELRERLTQEVRDILRREGMTALIVTHDQNEAFALADVVGVMHEGIIQQWDTPYNLYHQPANRFVADFVGQGVFLPGMVLNNEMVEIELGVLHGMIPTDCDATGCGQCVHDCYVDVLLRPDDIVHDDESLLIAEVENKAFRGADFLYTLKLPSGARALSLVPSHHDHAIGEMIGIKLAVDHVVAYRRVTPGAPG
ncbi:ABC transporter ATP-binding protein [Betaproteobacteria bacterium SCN2]|jgi:iron(III) transport system ATP-binding protein|nr:ABC transporter ATP-binding protein [Betaproteobacteria bacterium SCN2]